ncbi:MAG: hypothetical protein KGO50_16055 [Myxococcales bacterium]|nr:hypothetical protein [Myxococcales bacterium]
MRYIHVSRLVPAFVLMLALGLAPSGDIWSQTLPDNSPDTGRADGDASATEPTDALPALLWSSEHTGAIWDDVAVSITMRDPFSPYAESIYEWKSRGQSPMVVLTRVHVAGWGRSSELGLVAIDEYQGMLNAIEQCVMAESGMEGAQNTRAVELSISLRQVQRRYEEVVHVEQLTGTCVDELFRMVEERVELPPYRMPFWEEDEWGALQAGSDLPARVYVDGWDTRENTPMTGLRLEPGVHRVVWRSLQGDLTKELDVTIERGRTTTVNVVLE